MTRALAGTQLRFSSDSEPGYHRRRAGLGFTYVDDDGNRLSDDDARARIDQLVIPPAWTDVWICPDADGHVQVTGRDAKHRKQYLYHEDWRRQRDADKFDDLAAFGLCLSRLRRQVDADMRSHQLDHERVVATAVWLLDSTLVRVGNDEYARAGDSFGLTTLRDRHARVDGSELRFRFNGKSGKPHDVVIHDRRVANTIRRCRDLPGQRLIQCVTGDEVRAIGSRDVNDYLRQAMSADFTAKMFRTWGGTLIAFQYLVAAGPPESQRESDRLAREAIHEASEHLRNTPAVCRRSYVHPAVLTSLDELDAVKRPATKWMSADERTLLAFLDRAGG